MRLISKKFVQGNTGDQLVVITVEHGFWFWKKRVQYGYDSTEEIWVLLGEPCSMVSLRMEYKLRVLVRDFDKAEKNARNYEKFQKRIGGGYFDRLFRNAL